MTASTQLRWASSYVRPYRRAFTALALLSFAEIALRIAAPFAMLFVVDHALGTAPVSGTLASMFGDADRTELLVTFAATGMTLQIVHEVVVMWHGRLSVRVGQGMIRDVREQLFGHIQPWSLKHHGAMPAGDAVQRLEADTRCVDQIVLRGVFPVAFSLLTLVVMFGVLLTIHVQLALLSLSVLPPLYAWLRYYARQMAPRADHARRTDSRVSTRLFATITAIRLINPREAGRDAGRRAARRTSRSWTSGSRTPTALP